MSGDLPTRQAVETVIAQMRIVEEQRDSMAMRLDEMSRELAASQAREADKQATIRTLLDIIAQHAIESVGAVQPPAGSTVVIRHGQPSGVWDRDAPHNID